MTKAKISTRSERKITIISIYYPPEQGAAATRIASMAKGLAARNMAVNVISALPNYPTGRIFQDYRGTLMRSEIVDGVPVKRYWLYPSNSAVSFKRILNIVSFSAVLLVFAIPHLLKIRPDTIIVNSPPLPVGLSGVILAKLVRARAIANVSDIWPLSALELGAIRKGWLYSLLEKIELWVYRLSDAVVSQSNDTRQHVLERTPDKKTYLYRNLEQISEHAHQYPAIGEQPVKIVYAGLLGVAQGVYDICRSIGFKEIGVEFHLYGHGNERSKIERYIADNPDCNVFLRDMVPKTELPKVLSQFHATIVPLRSNIHGAFPSKIYMAMSASLPVLFSGAGEGAAFVQESGIGWVSGPANFAGLRENIQTLSKMDSRDYEALRSRIKSLTTEQYDFETQLDRFVQFIDSI